MSLKTNYFFPFLLILGISNLAFTKTVFPEGTKQLQPDSTTLCDILFYPEGGYPCTGVESCDSLHKFYIRVGSDKEKVYLGMRSSYFQDDIVFRIKLGQTVVFGPVTITSGSIGWIDYYSQAYAGPDIISPSGYHAIVFEPGAPGDYSIDFDPVAITILDVTVIDTTAVPRVAIDGRLYTRQWQFTTSSISSPAAKFLATQYILTDDSIVTSIYYNEMRGHHFDVTSTRNGCYPSPVPWDSSCRSIPGNHHYAQYRIFVNDPDSVEFPTGVLGMINESTITVVPQCDGSVSVSFSVNKPGSVRINFEIDPSPGIQPVDVSILDSVKAGSNTIVWNGMDGLGNPVPANTEVTIGLTYVNGLTNIALYDVERHLKGFLIRQRRPYADSIATYWNDTLLQHKGGVLQLSGCYPTPPDSGCHAWDGDYLGVGLGSVNTVNTWWYATSSSLNLSPAVIQRPPDSVENILGVTTVCNSGVATYSVFPDSVPGADPDGYEWVMVDVATGLTEFDSSGQGSIFTINFSGIPPGQKYLKVRGHNQSCGAGPFGPGEGILISILPAPSITNPENTFTQCSGELFTLQFQTSPPTASVSYTAEATSPNVSGYSGGTQNPLSQVLTTTGTVTYSVIYRVVPFSEICPGDTDLFFVRVSPIPEITNSQTFFEQCSGLTTNLILTGNYPGVNFSWTATGSSPLVSGFFNDTGTVIAQTLLNTGPISETVTYVVTPGFDSCPGNPIAFIFTILPSEPVSVSITASPNPFCTGASVSFTANPENGGSTPSYQWMVNGISAGSNSPLFVCNPGDGDIVMCILTSSELCTSGNPASSNPITMIGNLSLPAGVSVAASPNPFCHGASVSFLAVSINGGTDPTYQWTVNGIPTGTNSPLFSYAPANQDLVWCMMTSNLECIADNPAISDTILMNESPAPFVAFTPCFDTITTTNAKPILLRGGIPLGGVYSGVGVNNGYFYPSVAGPGNHMLSYLYTNSALCSDTGYLRLLNLQASPFSCGGLLTDVRDGSVYPTVQIGPQCWMAGNLDYGSEIPFTVSQRNNCIPEKYKLAVGSWQLAVYQWDELMRYEDTEQIQGLCPPGWHVPSEADWNQLFAFYQGNAFAGSPLLYSGYSGFNVQLSGIVVFNKGWEFEGFATIFWSSSSHGPFKAWAHGMNDYNYSVSYYPGYRANALSVRCLED